MAYILGFNDAVVAAANLYLTGGGGGSGATIPGTVVVGDLLTADTTSSFARIAAPAVGQVLKSNGVGVAPSWSASPSLASLALGGATIGSNALAVAGSIETSTSIISNQNVYTGANGVFAFGNTHALLKSPADGVFQVLSSSQINGFLVSAPLAIASAAFQHGALDAASPVAQTIKFQDVVAGTSNTAGVNATIQAPAGTGTGAGGSLIFQVSAAGSSGSAKNPWATALTIGPTGAATFASSVIIDTLRVNNINNFGNTRTFLTFASGTDTAIFGNGMTTPIFQFAAATSAAPALRRNGTVLEVKLADNSAFTNIQGKLTTNTAYTAGDPTTTGYLVVYDSTGTAYRVPALLN